MHFIRSSNGVIVTKGADPAVGSFCDGYGLIISSACVKIEMFDYGEDLL